MKDITLYVLCGLPASGKTTIAKQFENELGVKRRSYDDMPNANKDKESKEIAWKQWTNEILTDLQNGNDVICDSLSLTRQSRIDLLFKFSNVSCNKILIVLQTPIEECKKRNKLRDKEECVSDMDMHFFPMIFEQPNTDEGCDEIYYICHK